MSRRYKTPTNATEVIDYTKEPGSCAVFGQHSSAEHSINECLSFVFCPRCKRKALFQPNTSGPNFYLHNSYKLFSEYMSSDHCIDWKSGSELGGTLSKEDLEEALAEEGNIYADNT